MRTNCINFVASQEIELRVECPQMIIKELEDPLTQTVSLPVFHCRDRYGVISIHRLGNILVSQFSGPCSHTIVEKYFHGLLPHIEAMNGEPWAYMSISRDIEAVTQSALAVLDDSFARSARLGCVADAYVINSALGREQLRSLREKYVKGIAFSEVLFDSYQSAFSYLQDRLSDYSQRKTRQLKQRTKIND